MGGGAGGFLDGFQGGVSGLDGGLIPLQDQ
jgi:hypothetical protein